MHKNSITLMEGDQSSNFHLGNGGSKEVISKDRPGPQIGDITEKPKFQGPRSFYTHILDLLDNPELTIEQRRFMYMEQIGEEFSEINMDSIDNSTAMLDSFTMIHDTVYVKCSVIGPPDSVVLHRPVTNICQYFDEQIAIFYSESDYYNIVNQYTLAIVDVKYLPGNHMASGKASVVYAECNWSATDYHARHLYYAIYDAVTGKTIVVGINGRLLTDTAKTYSMVWNADAKMFEKMAGVARHLMGVFVRGKFMILTDEGLAYYDIDDIWASTGDIVKPWSAIALGYASHCMQAYAVYSIPGFIVCAVLTDKGMIQYVDQNKKDGTFKIAKTVHLDEDSKSNTVFSAITCMWPYDESRLLVVAGFDVDQQANILILLDSKGYLLSHIDVISHDDMPIVDMTYHHDDKLNVAFIISWSIMSVYVHCVNAKYKMT